jgi:hypothetical protein
VRQRGDADRTPAIGLELVRQDDQFVLRDTANPAVWLVYNWAEIDAFLHGAKGGEFDQFVAPDGGKRVRRSSHVRSRLLAVIRPDRPKLWPGSQQRTAND